MYRLEREEFLGLPYVFLWSLLAFQAGYINAFGFLACGRYVTHVTGFGTQIGVAIADKDLLLALEFLGFPIFFILGSFASAFVTAARIEKLMRPRFDLITAILPLIVLMVLAGGEAEVFGHFRERIITTPDFALLYMLSLFSGIQNGCFAVLTKGQIRTTHLTGISTDIGTDLARTYFGNLSPKELILTKLTNFSRLLSFVGFASGSVISVFVSKQAEYAALAVPLLTSTFVFLFMRKTSRKLDEKFGASVAFPE